MPQSGVFHKKTDRRGMKNGVFFEFCLKKPKFEENKNNLIRQTLLKRKFLLRFCRF